MEENKNPNEGQHKEAAEESLKKLLYAGVGIANKFVEEIGKSLDDLASRSVPLADEGKKIVEEMMNKTAKDREEFKKKINDFAQEAKSRADEAQAKRKEAKRASVKSEMEELKKRLADLEKQMDDGISDAEIVD
jgi:polyhydroxyalkanoate synthesis regulator phasin